MSRNISEALSKMSGRGSMTTRMPVEADLTPPPRTRYGINRSGTFYKAMQKSSIFREVAKRIWSSRNPEEQYGRYGYRSTPFRYWLTESKHMLALFLGIAGIALHYNDVTYRDELLSNIEVNRQRFYDCPFEPEYVGVPPGETQRDMHAIYDTPTVGYNMVDNKSGLKKNIENRMSAPNMKELRKNVQSLTVSEEDLEKAKLLRQHQDIGTRDVLGDNAKRVF